MPTKTMLFSSTFNTKANFGQVVFKKEGEYFILEEEQKNDASLINSPILVNYNPNSHLRFYTTF